jgi:DNA invertase Pin-like site-specific DNA recombinase
VARFTAEWLPRLNAILAEWAATLPPEAASWVAGAAYVRVSSARSLGGESPDVQLRNVLAMMAQRCYGVAPEHLFFDVASATDIGARAAFQRMFELALTGGVKAIGVFVGDRLFRNLEQAMRIKNEFRVHGIELVYLGKFEGDQRNPSAWLFETTQDTAADYQARTTGYQVGLSLEERSRRGQPVGGLPEVYPPDKQEAAVNLVIEQARLFADDLLVA